MYHSSLKTLFASLATLALVPAALAQQPSSPEVDAQGYITWRLNAPSATEVFVSGNDLPQLGQPRAMQQTREGIWELTLGPAAPGAYRYSFVVDGATVLDYRNPSLSESNDNAWSMVVVPGSPVMDLQDVPRGLVSEVNYHSQVLGRERRMHVYTPPGYMKNNEYYPVLYLLHGAMDSDDSWSSVGRAGVILDNLIASGQVEPMVVVMPAGHTSSFRMGVSSLPLADFAAEFDQDIRRWAAEHLRILGGADSTAIAGLSMGGAQTLEIAFDHPQEFGYVGVFSSGVFGINESDDWEQARLGVLDDEAARQNLKLFWLATGRDDFLIETSRQTVSMFQNHGYEVNWVETGGGHTWLNWRDYLAAFTPQLFR